MTDSEQQQRERAYKIWEDEGRPDGAHDDHWKRAGQGADEATEANQEMNEKFNGREGVSRKAPDIPTSSIPTPD